MTLPLLLDAVDSSQVYFPSWIIIAIIAKVGIFPKTNVGILIVYCILAGVSLNSYSILGASIFKRAQLSGITVVVVAFVIGIAAQISAKYLTTAAVVILGILFTPMTFVFNMIWMARYEVRMNGTRATCLDCNPRMPFPEVFHR